jgi:hypothetical protein
MSELRSDEHVEEESAGDAEAPPAAASTRQRRSYGVATWLAALLIVVLAGVALSPFWAPQLGPLLPWGTRPAISSDEYAGLAARVAAVEQRPPAPSVNVDELRSAVNGLGQRIDKLETAVNGRIAASPADVDAIKSQVSGLTQRVDQIEAASGGDRQLESSVAAAKTGLQNLEQRLAAVEAQSASRKASDAADLQNLQQELARLGTMTTDLTNRVGGLEHERQSQNTAERRTDAMLALLLVQMREAVVQARPFPAEYSAFVTLARDSGLAAAAEPLAGAARNGVVSRAVLVKRLAELAAPVTTANEPAAEPDLGQRVLAHLRGLVTIRRIDGTSQTGPEASVSAAQTALARGDLTAAVTALDALTGANAEAAGPWLRMARERLAVEAALDHLQELLTVRLESAPPAHPASPPAAPQEPSEKARTPS